MNNITKISDGLQNSMAGLTPARDKAQNNEYVVDIYDYAKLTNMYRSSPMAGRVVDQRAEDSFRKWRSWQGDASQISKIEAVEKRIGLKLKMEEAQKKANLYGQAYLIINDGGDPTELLDPKTIGLNGITTLTVLDRGEISEGEISQDIFSPYYNEPEYYHILTASAGIATVHPSRLVKLYGNKRLDTHMSGSCGDSILQRGMSALVNLDATMANVASLVFEAKVDVMSIKGLAGAMDDPTEEAAIMSRLTLAMAAKGNNGVLILDADGEVYEQKKMSFATLPELIESFQIAFCAAFGYPRTLLFGDETGGLGNSGSMSKETYYNSVSSDQENVLQPSMYIIDECILYDALGSRPPEMYYEWNALWSMSDAEIATIGKTIAETFGIAVDKGLLSIDVANQAFVNALVERGVSPGLETLQNEYGAGDDLVNPSE